MRSDIIADRWRDVAFEARALVYHGSQGEPSWMALSDAHNASYIAELTITPAGSDLPLLRLDEPVDAERELLALLVEAPADIKVLLAEIARLRAAEGALMAIHEFANDDGNWEHEEIIADDGMFIGCDGRYTVEAMASDALKGMSDAVPNV